MLIRICSFYTLNNCPVFGEYYSHEKGSFTGASNRRIGRFEEADRGTLFLDEIGDISPLVQVKILRFLQELEFQRVGGNQTIRADVRIISATNQDLGARIAQRTGREARFYRVTGLDIGIPPPLRERKEDLPALIDHFLTHFAAENGKQIQGISPEARDLFMKYDYPGNVRELENIIERAVVITRGLTISSRDLPFSGGPAHSNQSDTGNPGTLKESIDALERKMVEDALRSTENHQTRAAGLLGISERMLRYKVKKYGLK